MKCKGSMAWGDAHLVKGLLCKHRALSVKFPHLHPTPVLGRRDSRAPGACHPQSLVNQCTSWVTNPGAKVKVDRGGGKHSVETSRLPEHEHVCVPHTSGHIQAQQKVHRHVWQFSKYKNYYAEQEISYLSQIPFCHFLLNLLQRDLLGFPGVLVRHRPLNSNARQEPRCYLTTL